MKVSVRISALLVCIFACLAAGSAFGQVDPTASRGIEISLFGGPTGVFTGLSSGHNISFTAGADIGFGPVYGLIPSAEIRGLYPLTDGSVDDQKNILGGARLEKRLRGLRVYGDFLFGRGSINYLNGGYLDPAGTYRYVETTSNVFSPGAGLAHDITPLVSLFADVQFQHYSTPVTTTGRIWSTPITVGVVYRLPYLKHGRPY